MNKLSTKHYMFILFGTGIVSLKTYVSLFVQDGGRDTWVLIILVSILVLLIYSFLIQGLYNAEFNSLGEVYSSAFGNLLGKIFFYAYIFNIFLSCIESSALEASAMHTNMFLETPVWYLILWFVIPAMYTISKDLSAIKICTIIGIFFIFIAGINLAILSSKYKESRYLFPLLEQGFNIGQLTASLKLLGGYSSLAIAFPYLSHVAKSEKMKKHTLIALILIIQMEIVSVIGVIATFGALRSANIFYPKLIQTQRISYFGFLESGEFFVMFQIVGGWFVKYILSFYSIVILLNLFNKKLRYFYVFLLTGIIGLLAYLFSKNNLYLFHALNYYLYICLFNYVLVPLIMLFIIKLNKGKVPSN